MVVGVTATSVCPEVVGAGGGDVVKVVTSAAAAAAAAVVVVVAGGAVVEVVTAAASEDEGGGERAAEVGAGADGTAVDCPPIWTISRSSFSSGAVRLGCGRG